MKYNFLSQNAYFIYETHNIFDTRKLNIAIIGIEDVEPKFDFENNRIKEINERGIIFRCLCKKENKNENVINEIYKELNKYWMDNIHKEFFKLKISFIDDYCYAQIESIQTITETHDFIEFNISFNIQDGVFYEEEKELNFEVKNNEIINVDAGMFSVDYILEIKENNNEKTNIEIIIEDKYEILKEIKLFTFKDVATLKIDLFNQEIIINDINKIEELAQEKSLESIEIFTTLSRKLPDGLYTLKIKTNNENYKAKGVLRYTPKNIF